MQSRSSAFCVCKRSPVTVTANVFERGADSPATLATCPTLLLLIAAADNVDGVVA